MIFLKKFYKYMEIVLFSSLCLNGFKNPAKVVIIATNSFLAY